MPSKTVNNPPPSHPPLGTLIDGGSLQLVDVIGLGGYGVCYRAIETANPSHSYAVKCLFLSHSQTSRQRQLHLREIMLHRLSSAHPNVVTLHRVVDEGAFTFIIMDYAKDGDLFTQILNNRRYLGNNALIKHVFLQLIDAVEHCHHLGIYHRDLKPENILCFEKGYKVLLTDFGLATTDRLSQEFRTGSVYHMSPECQNGLAPYSPLHNDIWSLAIILLNLTTGRNPWKSASRSDPTFQAFMHDPIGFLPSVLPISGEANELLVQMLDLDWRQRPSLLEIREAVEQISTFYSSGAIFQGSMARCPWEADMEIEGEPVPSESLPELSKEPSMVGASSAAAPVASQWSSDDSEIVFADLGKPGYSNYQLWSDDDINSAWELDTSMDDVQGVGPALSSPQSSAAPSLPSTPNSDHTRFVDRTRAPARLGLIIDTDCAPRYYGDDEDTLHSSIMQTAVDGGYAESYIFAPSPSSTKVLRSAISPRPDSAMEWSDWDGSNIPSPPSPLGPSFTEIDMESPAVSVRRPRFPIQEVDTDVESDYPSCFPIPQSNKTQNSLFKFFPHRSTTSSNSTSSQSSVAAPSHRKNLSQPDIQSPHPFLLSSACAPWATYSSAATKQAKVEQTSRLPHFLRSPRQWFTSGRFHTSSGHHEH